MTPSSTPARPFLLTRRDLAGGAAVGVAVTVLSQPGFGQSRPAHEAQAGRGDAAPALLDAREGSAALRGEDQPGTAVWGYGGAVPGPTLRVKRGEELRLRLANALAEPTLVHWHGVRAPDAVDGVPFLTTEPLGPEATVDLRFAPPDAGTFWYHAHPIFPGQRERGLYGPLIVDESAPVGAEKDVLLMLDDWRLRPDGALAGAAESGTEHASVNGRPSLDIALRANERLRLRLVNASRTRLFGVRLEDHRPVVVAIDGQPAEPFPARDGRVALAPGNRVDLFVDATQAPGATARVMLDAGGPPAPIARLVYTPEPAVRAAPLPAPKPLPANALPERMELAKALRVALPVGTAASTKPPAPLDWRNAAAVRNTPPLFTVARGRPVVLAIANGTSAAQLFHLHNQPFRLLDSLDDGWKPFWLDTYPVPPGQTARVAFVPETAGKRMLHTRPLAQPEAAAFFWYAVT